MLPSVTPLATPASQVDTPLRPDPAGRPDQQH